MMVTMASIVIALTISIAYHAWQANRIYRELRNGQR